MTKTTTTKAIEILDAIGTENEHEGIKWTKFFMDKWDKKEREQNQLKEENLKKKRMTKKRYYEALAGMLNEQFKQMDKPSNKWIVLAFYTDKGVVVQLKDIWGRVYQRAFKPCGIPKIDLHVVGLYLGGAEDTMYKVEAEGKTASGIYLK
jgi:hypothetical protein